MRKTAPKPGPEWIEADRRHVWRPYTQMLTAPPPVPVERAEGVYLYTSDGRRILDGISSWWVNLHGHNHPRLNRALQEQASRLAQVIFAGFSHEPAARLAEALVARAPAGLTRVFYSDDGSTAVEVALKMTYQFWRNRGEPGRNLFVALADAYHGDTFGAMAVGGIPVFHQEFSDLFFEVRRVHSPHCFRNPAGVRPMRCAAECSGSLQQVLESEASRVAGVIIEPMVQAAGGMIIWPVEFLRMVRDATREAGVPLIADEVFTGFGRTGRLFACQHGPLSPEILCLSKGLTGGYLPLGATLVSEPIFEAFLSTDRGKTFFHGHSFTGNALSCAVARESLTLFEEENRLGRVRELEGLFARRLARLQGRRQVAEVRGIGGLAVVELKSEGGYLDSRGPELAAAFLQRDVLLRPLGNVIYFLPPYVITDQEAEGVFDIIEEVIAELG